LALYFRKALAMPHGKMTTGQPVGKAIRDGIMEPQGIEEGDINEQADSVEPGTEGQGYEIPSTENLEEGGETSPGEVEEQQEESQGDESQLTATPTEDGSEDNLTPAETENENPELQEVEESQPLEGYESGSPVKEEDPNTEKPQNIANTDQEGKELQEGNNEKVPEGQDEDSVAQPDGPGNSGEAPDYKFQISSLYADLRMKPEVDASEGLALRLEQCAFQEVLLHTPMGTIMFAPTTGVESQSDSFTGTLDATEDLTDWLSVNALISTVDVTAEALPIDTPVSAKLRSIDLTQYISETISLPFSSDPVYIQKQFGPSIEYNVADGKFDEVIAAIKTTEDTGAYQIPSISTLSDLCFAFQVELPSWERILMGGIGISLAATTKTYFPRNAFWFASDQNVAVKESHEVRCRSLLRLEFTPDVVATTNILKAFLGTMVPNIDLGFISIIYKRMVSNIEQNSTGDVLAPKSELIIVARSKDNSGDMKVAKSMRVAIFLSADTITGYLTWPEQSPKLEDFLIWINEHVLANHEGGHKIEHVSEHLQGFVSLGSNGSKEHQFRLAQAKLTVREKKIESIDITFIGDIPLGAKELPFLVIVKWQPGKLECDGKLLFKGNYHEPNNGKYPVTLVSTYEESVYFEMPSNDKLPEGFDLTAILPQGQNALQGLSENFNISIVAKSFEMKVILENKIPTMNINAKLNLPNNRHALLAGLQELNLVMEVTKVSNNTQLKLDLNGSIVLGHLTSLAEQKTISFPLELLLQNKEKSEFKITGDRLRVIDLISLFEQGHEQESILGTMGNISISNMNISYEFQRKSASSLRLDAKINVGNPRI
jgi:hypothetical protein